MAMEEIPQNLLDFTGAIMKHIGDLLSWMKQNDLPNWLGILFTAILWPLVLFLWTRRTVRDVPNLEISPSKGTIKVKGKDYDSVDLNFLNNTGSIVYITNVRLLKCSRHFVIPTGGASRDIASFSHELKFFESTSKMFVKRQITLQTNDEAATTIAATVNDDFFSFKSGRIRKFLRLRKYFCLQYVALVGVKRYKVRTPY